MVDGVAELANLTQLWAVDSKLAGNTEGVSVMVGFRDAKDQPANLTELQMEYCPLHYH